jgi:hypothetical protein
MLSTMNTKLDSFLNQTGQMLNRGNNNSNWSCDWIVFDIVIDLMF